MIYSIFLEALIVKKFCLNWGKIYLFVAFTRVVRLGFSRSTDSNKREGRVVDRSRFIDVVEGKCRCFLHINFILSIIYRKQNHHRVRMGEEVPGKGMKSAVCQYRSECIRKI